MGDDGMALSRVIIDDLISIFSLTGDVVDLKVEVVMQCTDQLHYFNHILQHRVSLHELPQMMLSR